MARERGTDRQSRVTTARSPGAMRVSHCQTGWARVQPTPSTKAARMTTTITLAPDDRRALILLGDGRFRMAAGLSAAAVAAQGASPFA